MFILDDILLAPFKGVLWVFRKVHEAARDEIEGQTERLKGELSDLYMQLDTGRITEEEFDAREKAILDKLDRIKKVQEEEAAAAQPPPPEETEER